MSLYKCTSFFLIMFKFDNIYLFGPNNCTDAIYKINLWKDKILTEREINLQHENTPFNFGPFKDYAYQNAVYFWSLISEYNVNQAIFICFLFIFSILKNTSNKNREDNFRSRKNKGDNSRSHKNRGDNSNHLIFKHCSRFWLK